jgi:hypothetical protein
MKHKALTSTLGHNATNVLTRIKLATDPEPKLTAGPDNLLSNDWVEWHMRQTGVPRKIALNRGYAMIDFDGDRCYMKAPLFTVDEGLRILGFNVIEDYFFTTKDVFSRLVKVRPRLYRKHTERLSMYPEYPRD